MADSEYTDSGRLLKMEVDYSGTVDEKIPVCEKLAQVSRFIDNHGHDFVV
jgi:26S proteasome regulatory subunit N5